MVMRAFFQTLCSDVEPLQRTSGGGYFSSTEVTKFELDPFYSDGSICAIHECVAL